MSGPAGRQAGSCTHSESVTSGRSATVTPLSRCCMHSTWRAGRRPNSSSAPLSSSGQSFSSTSVHSSSSPRPRCGVLCGCDRPAADPGKQASQPANVGALTFTPVAGTGASTQRKPSHPPLDACTQRKPSHPPRAAACTTERAEIDGRRRRRRRRRRHTHARTAGRRGRRAEQPAGGAQLRQVASEPRPAEGVGVEYPPGQHTLAPAEGAQRAHQRLRRLPRHQQRQQPVPSHLPSGSDSQCLAQAGSQCLAEAGSSQSRGAWGRGALAATD
jgi:hypothetical protein